MPEVDVDTVERWCERLMTAGTVDEVFAEG
jgi:hypothetical protein